MGNFDFSRDLTEYYLIFSFVLIQQNTIYSVDCANQSKSNGDYNIISTEDLSNVTLLVTTVSGHLST